MDALALLTTAAIAGGQLICTDETGVYEVMTCEVTDSECIAVVEDIVQMDFDAYCSELLDELESLSE